MVEGPCPGYSWIFSFCRLSLQGYVREQGKLSNRRKGCQLGLTSQRFLPRALDAQNRPPLLSQRLLLAGEDVKGTQTVLETLAAVW